MLWSKKCAHRCACNRDSTFHQAEADTSCREQMVKAEMRKRNLHRGVAFKRKPRLTCQLPVRRLPKQHKMMRTTLAMGRAGGRQQTRGMLDWHPHRHACSSASFLQMLSPPSANRRSKPAPKEFPLALRLYLFAVLQLVNLDRIGPMHLVLVDRLRGVLGF